MLTRQHRLSVGAALAVFVSAQVADARVPMMAVTSKDGLITISAPASDGWECVEQTTPNPYPTELMRCRRKVAGEFFLLTVKQYQVPKEQIKTVDELANKVFPQDYKTFYTTYQITSTAPVSHQSLSGVELRVDSVHPNRGELRKVEQIFVQGHNVFVLSAEGARVQFGSWKAVIDDWMAGARFKVIAGDTTPALTAKPSPPSPGGEAQVAPVKPSPTGTGSTAQDPAAKPAAPATVDPAPPPPARLPPPPPS